MHRIAFLIVGLGSLAWAQPVAEPAPPADPAPPPDAPPEPAPAPAPAPVETPLAMPVTVTTETHAPATVPSAARTTVELEGYIQPQFRVRQDSQVQDDTNGFRFARVRPMIRARTTLPESGLEAGAFFEVELQPTFQLVDGFAGISKKFGHGVVAVDVGQMRVPISRQQLLSDSRLAWVDKGLIATIAPRRDLGGRLTLVLPWIPQVKLLAGVFNGEGPNQIENINQKFLYAGRIEATVLGKEGALAEGGFGDAFLTLAGSIGHNQLTNGDRQEKVLFAGGDVAMRYKGLSGSFEYLLVRHRLSTTGDPTMLPPDFDQNGWVGQLNYLLPIELPLDARFELGARVEEIDRNDAVPIAQAGELDQSQRVYAAVITYYLRKHSLKAQLALSHFTEIEDETVTGENAVYDNDQAMLQLTYRME